MLLGVVVGALKGLARWCVACVDREWRQRNEVVKVVVGREWLGELVSWSSRSVPFASRMLQII